ncbi:hypothetical protein BC833DRAFT_596760 [Globomyces pollinis-pini]|nr:hypothetical protein BC833DRAFT_596760 [Globomyces pollinis-pini]
MIQSKDDLANISNSDYEFECLQQFLIYIASKDYQKALPLSETLRKLNPSNQMFQEYESVLKQRLSQIQQDINELDEADDDDDSGISEPELEDESSDEDESDS